MDIPFLDLKAQYRSIKSEIDGKLKQVVESQKFILGEEVAMLEREIADYGGTQYAVGVSSGSDALIISLMALGIGEGDFVVTTPFTFFATAGAAGVDFGMNAQEAVAAPRFCTTSDTIDVTNRILRRTQRALEDMGYRVRRSALSYGFAGVHALRRTPAGWDGGADPGRDGMALRI